ncbi:S-layer homology domain-containing protein [Bacillus cereus]|nr:S-layer homology domain-containing protein [Bacillus cereus]
MRPVCTYSLGFKSRVVKTVAEMINVPFYPAIRRAVKLPPQNSGGAKKLGGRSAARKRPIGEG